MKLIFKIWTAISILFLLAVGSFAFGQNLPISGLPAATTPLAGSELAPIVQGGVTKKVAVSYFAGNGVGSVTGIFGITSTGSGTVYLNADTSRNAKIGLPTIYYIDSILTAESAISGEGIAHAVAVWTNMTTLGYVNYFTVTQTGATFNYDLANMSGQQLMYSQLKTSLLGTNFGWGDLGLGLHGTSPDANGSSIWIHDSLYATSPYFFNKLGGSGLKALWVRNNGQIFDTTVSGGGGGYDTTFASGYGLSIGRTSDLITYKADTTKLIPYSDTLRSRKNPIITLNNLKAQGYGAGTVTSVGSGYGLTGGAITTTGTLLADSTKLIPWNDTLAGRSDRIITNHNLLSKGYLSSAVTSVATSFGLTGGTITSTGTLKVDTVRHSAIGLPTIYFVDSSIAHITFPPDSALRFGSNISGSRGTTFVKINAIPSGSTEENQYDSSGWFRGNQNWLFNGYGIQLHDSYRDIFIGGNIPAGNANNTLYDNIGIGDSAEASAVDISDNTAIGNFALSKNTTAGANTALGYKALYKTTNGNNTAIGSEALQNNTTGHDNVAIGSEALFSTNYKYDLGFGTSAIADTNNEWSLCDSTHYARIYAKKYKLPEIAPTAGQVLADSGKNGNYNVIKWTTVSGGSPAGSTGNIQFNSSGSFGANNNLNFASNIFNVGASGIDRCLYTQYNSNTGGIIAGGDIDDAETGYIFAANAFGSTVTFGASSIPTNYLYWNAPFLEWNGVSDSLVGVQGTAGAALTIQSVGSNGVAKVKWDSVSNISQEGVNYLHSEILPYSEWDATLTSGSGSITDTIIYSNLEGSITLAYNSVGNYTLTIGGGGYFPSPNLVQSFITGAAGNGNGCSISVVYVNTSTLTILASDNLSALLNDNCLVSSPIKIQIY